MGDTIPGTQPTEVRIIYDVTDHVWIRRHFWQVSPDIAKLLENMPERGAFIMKEEVGNLQGQGESWLGWSSLAPSHDKRARVKPHVLQQESLGLVVTENSYDLKE